MNIIEGAGTAELDTSVDHGYKYPNGLSLKPGTAFHQELLSKIMHKVKSSHDMIRNRHKVWQEIDRTLSAFVPVNEVSDSEDGNAAYKENEHKTKKRIVVPISYAIYDALLSQLTGTFLEPPYFRFAPVGPEDAPGAFLLEKVIHVQSMSPYSKVGLSLNVLLSDAVRYGLGIAAPRWARINGKKVVKEDKNFVGLFTNIFNKSEKVRKVKEGVVFEGNIIDNIDPYNFLPDPNVPLHDIQKGEFVGWVSGTTYGNLRRREAGKKSKMFNVKYLKGGSHSSNYSNDYRDEKSDLNQEKNKASGRIDVIYIYIDLIPKDWDLGDREEPEKWLFTVAGDKAILQAHPLELAYDRFPVVVCAPNYDGHSMSPISAIELNYGLQDIVDFLYNSRVANIKKSLNDMWLIDPGRVNVKDLLKPGPGKFARMRRQYYGRGTKDAVTAFPVHDVTQGHSVDATMLVDVMNRVSGVTDPLQGIQRTKGERVTAEEARGSKLGALTRIDHFAQIAGLQAFGDLAYMMAANVQLFMTESQYVEITGRWEKELKATYGYSDRVSVSPLDLVVGYDVMPHDGITMGGEHAQSWVQVLQIISSSEQLTGLFDMQRLVMHIGRLLGAKNVSDFINKEAQATLNISGNTAIPEPEALGGPR